MFSNELVCNILDYIDNNINRKFSIDDIVNKFFYNRYYIMKLFKQEVGITIIDYVNRIRIYNSLNEIKNSDNSFTMIALNNGFYSLEYFSEMFKKVMGVSASSYRKFCFFNIEVSEEEQIIIRNSLSNLYLIIEKTRHYKRNIKPKNIPVRKLSIFS